MAAQRTWLDVSYSEKDQAKAAGARWDATARRWYAPPGCEAPLQEWVAAPEVPDILPGEDRTFGQGLFVDLVPDSCWFTNVRSCVTERDWSRIRRMITQRAGMVCEACGASEDRETKRWLEGHERWLYDDVNHVQTLRRLVCLCTNCHEATHMGRAQITGRGSEAFGHLMTVTGMTEMEADSHVNEAFDLWRARSENEYSLDLSMLTDAGVTLRRPPKAEERGQIAQDALQDVR